MKALLCGTHPLFSKSYQSYLCISLQVTHKWWHLSFESKRLICPQRMLSWSCQAWLGNTNCSAEVSSLTSWQFRANCSNGDEDNAKLIMSIPCPGCGTCQRVRLSHFILNTVMFSHLVPSIREAFHCWNFCWQSNVLVEPQITVRLGFTAEFSLCLSG